MKLMGFFSIEEVIHSKITYGRRQRNDADVESCCYERDVPGYDQTRERHYKYTGKVIIVYRDEIKTRIP